MVFNSTISWFNMLVNAVLDAKGTEAIKFFG